MVLEDERLPLVLRPLAHGSISSTYHIPVAREAEWLHDGMSQQEVRLLPWHKRVSGQMVVTVGVTRALPLGVRS